MCVQQLHCSNQDFNNLLGSTLTIAALSLSLHLRVSALVWGITPISRPDSYAAAVLPNSDLLCPLAELLCGPVVAEPVWSANSRRRLWRLIGRAVILAAGSAVGGMNRGFCLCEHKAKVATHMP